MSGVQWLICVMAAIGFAFDIYELLMGPLVFPAAIADLKGVRPGTPEFGRYVAMLFYWPAVCGGIFGLLGGYLTDRFGRRRVLTWSILLYAVSAFLAGFSTSFGMLLVLRCTTFIGVCVEFVAAVAWLSELFEEHGRREKVLAYTQAFSSIGGLMVAVVNGWCVRHAMDLPAVTLPGWFSFGGDVVGPHAPWRYTLMSGLIPAVPLILIRPFLPESPAWKAKVAAGVLRRPSISALFSPELRRVTVVTTAMFALSYGAAFGAIQQVPQMVAGFPQVREKMEGKAPVEQARVRQGAAAEYAKVQEVGGLCGRFLLAVLVVRIVSRRALLRVFLVPGVVVMPLAFGWVALHNSTWITLDLGEGGHAVTLFHAGIFVAGLLTVAQFSFWGNYLPRMFPLHLRGTGEGFAANIGGRLVGTSFAAVANLMASASWMPGGSPAGKMAVTAALLGFLVYAAGLVFSAWLLEPSGAVEGD